MQIKVPIERTNSLESSTTAASTIVAPDPDAPSLALSADLDAKQVLISVTPPDKPVAIKSAKDSGKRPPLDICCVIDISGSMGTEAPIPADPTTGAPAESTGLSVLDVVKHAIRTIIATMQEDDRIALVTFSDSAQVQAGLTEMTEKGRSDVLEAINILEPQDCTNLWDGLKMGMDLLSGKLNSKAGSQKSSLFGFRSGKKTKTVQATAESSLDRFSTLFILTDGMPNIVPPRGHIPMLKAYLDALDNSHTFNISTFGFGYSLDSPLLLEIAQVGGGGYSFIPDSGIVGTVFVNAVANAYATYAPRVRVDVEIPEGTTVQVKGSFPITKTSWGVQIAAGDLQFGQTMDLVLLLSNVPRDIIATLNYRPSFASENCKVQATLPSGASSYLTRIKYHTARLEFVEILWSVKKADLPSSIKSLEALAKGIITSPVLANDSDALALEKDVSGEGLLALEAANYNRWGRHYLPSLARSHQRQQCGNFKDPGLQVYGRDSKVFIEERDKLDAAFMALPPPKPSVRTRSTYSGGKGGAAAAPARPLKSMKAYYSSSGPCFAGSCLVALPGGRYTRVDQLRRGMEIQTLCGTNKVAAVMRTRVDSGVALLCRVGDLVVTPWHPIVSQDSNAWVFPADVASPELLPCDAVYSLLLLRAPDGGAAGVGDPDAHSVSIAGVWCVTLGHGLTSGNADVRSHGFLGDYKRVLKEFSKLKGFFDNDGLVQCAGTRRDSSDGTICGFVGEEEGKENGGQIGMDARCMLCA